MKAVQQLIHYKKNATSIEIRLKKTSAHMSSKL